VDFLTFIIIAIFIYGIFAKKNKPPQRRQRSAEDPGGTVAPQQKKKEGIFQNLERQMRESAEKFERELQSGEGKSIPIEEGESAFDKYVSTQGTQGVEGVGGDEGKADEEGTWGIEGREYAKRQRTKAPAQQPEIGAGTIITTQETMPALGFSSSDLIRGVIWAEVLNEPRGRRGLSRR